MKVQVTPHFKRFMTHSQQYPLNLRLSLSKKVCDILVFLKNCNFHLRFHAGATNKEIIRINVLEKNAKLSSLLLEIKVYRVPL